MGLTAAGVAAANIVRLLPQDLSSNDGKPAAASSILSEKDKEEAAMRAREINLLRAKQASGARIQVWGRGEGTGSGAGAR